MNLIAYLDAHGSSIRLAKALGVAPAIISQWKCGVRPVPIEKCSAIEQATNGDVTRQDLRPEDWHLIWPELKKSNAA